MNEVDWIRYGIELGILIALWIITTFLTGHFIKGVRAYFINAWVFTIAFIVMMTFLMLGFRGGEIAREIISYLTPSFVVLAVVNFYWYSKELRRIKRKKGIQK